MPTSDELYDQAMGLRNEGKHEDAVKLLREIIGQEETHALAHAALAKLLTDLQQHEDAVRHAVRVTELEPNDPFSFTALSVTYQRAGFIPEAEEAMARARMMGQ